MKSQDVVQLSEFASLGAGAEPSASRALLVSQLVSLPFIDQADATALVIGLEAVVEEAAERRIKPLLIRTVALSAIGGAALAWALGR